MKYATKKAAQEVIRKTKEENLTFFFDGELEFSYMKNQFRADGYGEDETNFILAAMVNAGAKFKI